MEKLPDDIISDILGRLTDTRSLAHFAMTSRVCRSAAARADIVRRLHMPVRHADHVMHPDNVQYLRQVTPKGFHHCIRCFHCRCIIPVSLETIVINHQCKHHTYKHPTWANSSSAVLYRGTTQHLTQPLPCPDERLYMYNVKKPSVYPYAPLQA